MTVLISMPFNSDRERAKHEQAVHVETIMMKWRFLSVSHLIHGWLYGRKIVVPFSNAWLMIVAASILRLMRLLTEQSSKRLIAIDHRASVWMTNDKNIMIFLYSDIFFAAIRRGMYEFVGCRN